MDLPLKSVPEILHTGQSCDLSLQDFQPQYVYNGTVEEDCNDIDSLTLVLFNFGVIR